MGRRTTTQCKSPAWKHGSSESQQPFWRKNVDLSGTWTSPTAHASRTHLDGVWTVGGVPLTVRKDITHGEYAAETAEGIHIRYFSVSASNTLQSEEYVLPTNWTDTDYQYTVTQDLGAPVSLRLNGTWTRSLAGTSLTSKPIYWHTSAGNYELLSGVTQNPPFPTPLANGFLAALLWRSQQPLIPFLFPLVWAPLLLTLLTTIAFHL